MIKVTAVILFTILWSGHSVYAQKKCKDVLNRSDKLFQEGQIQEAVKTCEPCMNSLKSDEERFEAYRLLGISYLFLNNKRKSIQYAEKMIWLKPDYYKYPNIDPVEFTQLINKFEVRQIIYGGIKTGVNYVTPTILKSYSTFNTTSKYYMTTGYQFGGFAEYFYKPGIAFGTDLQFNGIYISQKVDNAGGNNQQYHEYQQSLLFLPYVNFYLNLPKGLRVYSGAGIGVNYMLNAMVNLETLNELTQVSTLTSKNAIQERNRSQVITSIKFGIGYPLGKGFIGFDMSYLVSLRNMVDPSKRLSDLDFIFNNQYINDDIKLSMFMFNISYHMPLYSIIENKNY